MDKWTAFTSVPAEAWLPVEGGPSSVVMLPPDWVAEYFGNTYTGVRKSFDSADSGRPRLFVFDRADA